MKRIFYVLLAVSLMAVLVLAACKPAPEATPEATTPPEETVPPEETEAPTAAPEPVTIIIGVTDQIASLDPADAYGVHDWELIKNMSEGLLGWKPGTTDIEPVLAEAMPEISADGLTYTLKLRSGIKFADGLELTAPLYAQQLNRLLTIGPTCPNDNADALAIPYVESITAPDDTTIIFQLKSPIAFFSHILATAPYVPSHPDIFPLTECVLFPTAPIYGVGPWYISQLTQNEQLVFEPNPYYTGLYPAQVDQIIVKYFSDPQTMSLAVQNGEIDIAWRFLDAETVAQLGEVAGLSANAVPGGGIRFLIVNHTMAPMDDPNVQKAIASLIDRDEIADTVYSGTVTPIYSMIPPGWLGANEAFDTQYAAPNIEQARQFLAASGYTETNKLVLDLWYPPEHYGASTAAWMELIKQQLEASGVITANLHAQEWSTYVTAATGGNSYPISVLGWFFDYPDPTSYMDPFTFNGGMGNNITTAQEGSTYGVPLNERAQELIDLLAQADVEIDQDVRADLYAQAQEIYAELVVTIPLFFVTEHVTYRDGIQGSQDYPYPETLNIGPSISFNYSLLTKNP